MRAAPMLASSIGHTEAPRAIGRYVLYGEIAAGGMGSVHFGRLVGAAGFSRAVAIKRLHAQFAKDPDFVAMLVDEARLAARISHPNVVQTLDVVQTKDEMLVVMEYVRGVSLSALHKAARAANERMPLRIAASIASGMLFGLHAAHEATDERGEPLGIVHRDVSPQNVLVGADGIARVLDFGVAKARGRLQNTRDGQLKGKISYIAPELVDEAPPTRRTDVYAAAVVLWEMLAGRRLFQGDTDVRVLQLVMRGAVPTPSAFSAEVPRALDAIVSRGLSRDPDRRWATCKEMADAIEAILPLAPATLVGEWVQRLAAGELDSRAARVADIERQASSSGSLPQAGPDASAVFLVESSVALPPKRSKRSKRLVVMAALAVLGIGVGLAVMLLRRQHPQAVPSAAVVSITPTIEVHTEPTAIPIESLPRADPPVVSIAPPPRPRMSSPTVGPKECDTPYTTDEKGHVHFKPQCL